VKALEGEFSTLKAIIYSIVTVVSRVVVAFLDKQKRIDEDR